MAEPCFRLRQEVHIVRKHCASCSELELQMQHPIKVRAIMAYGDGFTYRIEDAKSVLFNINEACLCRDGSGHRSNLLYILRPTDNVIGESSRVRRVTSLSYMR